MTRDWKVKGDPRGRPALFCPKCGRCMYTKEDLRVKVERGCCARCAEPSSDPNARVDVVTIVLGGESLTSR